MRTVEVVAATVMLVSTPVAPVATPAIFAAPVTPHVQLLPRKPRASIAPTPAPACQASEPGWTVWYPGQIAPYVLYGSTVDGQLHYEAPPGYVVLIYMQGSQSVTVMHPLTEWCPPPRT